MQKLIGAALLLFIISALNTKAFARSLSCSFKNTDLNVVQGVKSIQIHDDILIINGATVIALEQSRIKCGSFGKQNRYDGIGRGLQVILKSCTDEAALSGHIIDSVNSVVADVVCGEI